MTPFFGQTGDLFTGRVGEMKAQQAVQGPLHRTEGGRKQR